MNLSHLRAGIIGTGFIGPVHLEALKRLGVQVNALCGSRDSALALAKKWGVPDVYGDYDYEAMYASPNIDVVATAPDAETGVVRSREARADVVLFELAMARSISRRCSGGGLGGR